MTQNQNLFFQKFGITPNDLQRYLGEALSAGGDYADLYFEYLTSTSITVDESIVKSASQGISAGPKGRTSMASVVSLGLSPPGSSRARYTTFTGA